MIRGLDVRCQHLNLIHSEWCQFLDGSRQQGLLDVEFFRCAGEVKFLSHGQETPKVTQLHLYLFSLVAHVFIFL